ncbi:hypothetical protein GCM10027033_17430 [Leucobacter ruminantium]
MVRVIEQGDEREVVHGQLGLACEFVFGGHDERDGLGVQSHGVTGAIWLGRSLGELTRHRSLQRHIDRLAFEGRGIPAERGLERYELERFADGLPPALRPFARGGAPGEPESQGAVFAHRATSE